MIHNFRSSGKKKFTMNPIIFGNCCKRGLECCVIELRLLWVRGGKSIFLKTLLCPLVSGPLMVSTYPLGHKASIRGVGYLNPPISGAVYSVEMSPYSCQGIEYDDKERNKGYKSSGALYNDKPSAIH